MVRTSASSLGPGSPLHVRSGPKMDTEGLESLRHAVCSQGNHEVQDQLVTQDELDFLESIFSLSIQTDNGLGEHPRCPCCVLRFALTPVQRGGSRDLCSRPEVQAVEPNLPDPQRT